VIRRLKKIRPIIVNVAKTVAKILKHKYKVQNRYLKLLSNVKISTKNHDLKLLIWVKILKMLK